MSQYPSPYNPPPQYPYAYGYSTPQVDELAPAKRAAIMMWIVGGLLLVLGLCCGAISSVPFEQWPPDARAQWKDMPELADNIQTIFAIIGGLVAIPGLVLIVLAFFVRGGGMGAIITSIILTSIIVLILLGLVLLGMGSLGNQQGTAEGALAIVMFAVPLILFAILLFMLIGAVRASSAAQARAMQYQSQYWQYQQNQIGAPPPPPVPPGGPQAPPPQG